MQLIEHRNPLNLNEDQQRHDLPEGTNLQDWLVRRYGDSLEYVSTVTVDGTILQRHQWNFEVRQGQEIRVLLQPGDVWTIISVTMSVLSIGNAIFNPPPKPNFPGDPSPTYSLGAQQNVARVGAGVPIHYGQVRVWPDMAAQPYTVYQGNDQYVFQLFCIGIGEFSFGNLQIDDTDVSSFEEIESAFYYNTPVTLFPTNVETSVEPASQVLQPGTDSPVVWVGPYVANSAGTDANRLEVDIIWPSGLFRLNNEGKIRQAVCTLYFEYREIDDSGTPVGAWTAFIDRQITDAERSPKRMTFGVDVTAARYEVRGIRGATEDNGPQTYTRATWEGMRAFIETDALTYTDITVLAVKAKASANLNASSRRKFNVVATRKLPIYDPASSPQWSANTSTQSIAWALADMCRNEYLGNQADSKIDITQLYALDHVWEGRGDTFNFRFDTPTTRWDALKLIAAAGRAHPVLNSDVITFVRNQAQTVPVTIYNRYNIVQGTFKIEYKFDRDSAPDSILAEFIAPEHGWIKNTVQCTPTGSSGNNAKRLTLHGITDREQAFREGITLAQQARFQNKVCKFETELEGYIPSKGDLVKVINENFDMDYGGEIVAVTGSPAINLELSEPVTFSSDSPLPSHYIMLRKDNGEVSGPHLVNPGTDSYNVVLNSALDFEPYTGAGRERTKFAFGLLSSTAGNWVVEKITPRGGVKVELTCVNYVSSVHTIDQTSVPADFTEPTLLIDSNGPVIDYLVVEKGSHPGLVILGWTPAPGATSYVIEKQIGSPLTWVKVGQTDNNRFEFFAEPGALSIRVAGIGEIKGAWQTWSGTVSDYTLNSPTNLALSSALNYNSQDDYETRLIFTFDKPTDEIWIQFYEIQYKFPTSADWQALTKTRESTIEFPTNALGTIQARVRSVYVEDETYSSWASTSVVNTGTHDLIAAVGLAAPENPKLYLTLDEKKNRATIRLQVEWDKQTSPETAEPSHLALFYSLDDVPNQLEISNDTSSKLYFNTGGIIEGSFTLAVKAGSSTTAIKYTQGATNPDVDLSGLYWVRVEDASSPGNGNSRFYKVVEVDSETLYINENDPLGWTPQAGDTITIIELAFHDSRLPEFKLAYCDGEIIKHNGIQYDGNYYIDVVTRGAEGTVEADQTGNTFMYFPAYGIDTVVLTIPMRDFEYDSGVLRYTGNVKLDIPAFFSWGAISCCFLRKTTETTNAAFVRSNIVPLVFKGKA